MDFWRRYWPWERVKFIHRTNDSIRCDWAAAERRSFLARLEKRVIDEGALLDEVVEAARQALPPTWADSPNPRVQRLMLAILALDTERVRQCRADP